MKGPNRKREGRKEYQGRIIKEGLSRKGREKGEEGKTRALVIQGTEEGRKVRKKGWMEERKEDRNDYLSEGR